MNYAALSVPSAKNTQRVAATTASAATALEIGSGAAIVTCTAAVFMIRGAAPVAEAHTCAYVAAGVPYRVHGLLPGDKLAFITAAGTADVYVTPDA